METATLATLWRISTFRFDLKFIDGNANLESDG
jgi:hypothetical protein